MYGRPGVYVEEQLLTSAPSVDPSIATAVFIAAHGRGPTIPTEVRSWSEFTRIFGGFPARTSLLPYALFQYFNNGGSNAIILRVPGAGAAEAERIFNDRDAENADSTLTVTAENAGTWGNRLSIGITDNGPDRFTLTVFLGGVGSSSVVERFTDLSMDPENQRYVESVINSTRGGSTFIRVTDLNSPNSNEGEDYAVTRPVLTDDGPVELAGGLDGDTPDTEALVNAVDALGSVGRHFVLNFPAVSDESVINAAMTHCANVGNGFVIADPPPGITPDEAIQFGESLQNSSYGALYYPWIHVADPAAANQGATKLIPPGGAVAGLIAATDTTRGVWKAPAGLAARVAGSVALERTLSGRELDRLNTSHVNAVRHIHNSGICVFGSRTLKRADADKFIPIRRTLIYLRQALLEQTRWAIFEPNDRLLWGQLEANVSQFLTGFWQAGGLQGNSATEAFFVRADSSLNTPDVVQSGEVRVQVGVALRYPAEFIVITLSQWEGGSAVGEADLTIAEV